MRRVWSFLLVFIVLAPGCAELFGQDSIPLKVEGGGAKVVQIDKIITIKEPRTVVSSFPFTVQAQPGSGLYFWSYGAGVQAVDKGDTLEITAAPKGDLTISVKAVTTEVDWDKKQIKYVTKFGAVTFSVGEVAPPVPPGPTPPTPPTPGQSAIGVDGFAVMVVYESDPNELAKLPTGGGAYNLLFSQKFRDLITSKAVKDPDGKTPAFRIYDKDQAPDKDFKHWQDAFRRPRAGVPWLILSNPKIGGYEGPIPENVDEAYKLVQKYAN